MKKCNSKDYNVLGIHKDDECMFNTPYSRKILSNNDLKNVKGCAEAYELEKQLMHKIITEDKIK